MTRKRVTDCIPSYAKESKEHFLQTFQPCSQTTVTHAVVVAAASSVY